MRDHVSHAARTIPPSGIRRFFDLVQTMDDVISLGVGEPDYSTPWKAIDACMYALEQGQTSYTSNRGLPALCERITDDLARDFGLCYDPETEVIVTTGVSEGLDIAIRAVTDPGDEVLVAQPSYVSYGPCVTLAGGVPVPVPCVARDRFRLDPDRLMERVTPRSKALIINFPNNPTGAVMTASDLKGIADVVEDHDLVLLSDEVYGELSYETAARAVRDDRRAPRADDHPERVLQGLRHDRVAGRVPLRARRARGRGPQDPPVRDALRPEHGPGGGARGAPLGDEPRRRRWSRSTGSAGTLSSRA